MRRIALFAIFLSFAWLSTSNVALADSTTSYQYDALGRLIAVSYPDGTVITYSYDAAGNRTEVVVVAGSPSATKVVVLPLIGGLVIPVN